MEYVETVVAGIAGEASDITVEPAGGALFVSGTAASPSEAEMLLRGIRAVAGAPVVDALSIATPPQVNLEVLISEVSRNVTRELGIDWSVDLNPFEHPLTTWGTATGSRLASGALQIANIYDQVIDFVNPATGEAQFTNEISELGVLNPAPRGSKGGVVLTHSKEVNSGKYRAQAFLDALAQNGLLVMHARPSLTTVSGQPAEFFSGLEIPVPSITDRGVVGTQYRQTGVSLVFTPTVLDRGQNLPARRAARARGRRRRRDHRRGRRPEYQRTLGKRDGGTRRRGVHRHRGPLRPQRHRHRGPGCRS